MPTIPKGEKMFTLLQTNKRNDGYTAIEMLISLAIISTLLLIATPILKNLIKINELSKLDYQDEVGIYQLQIELAKNQILEINNDEIIYKSIKGERKISLVNNNLISQPGYLCYLRNLDYISFYKSFDIYYLEFERNEQIYTYPIAYQ